MVDLAILWHLHQPMYRHPVSGEFILPWVRLHASRAYYDMGRALEPHPEARVHLNVVPSLLDQLQSYAEGTARDRFLDLTERPAADLELEERVAVWRQFFMVDWDTEIRRIPRYHELLQRRGEDLAKVDIDRLARESSAEELRDLQVLFNLAWTGFALRAEDPALRELFAKGRGFSEQDKQPVLAAQRHAAKAIVPLYRALADRGQVELTATPYYHPILPLVIDSESARPGLPSAALPTPFRQPDDARWQVTQALESHAQRFGRRPLGMWPAEGSVSEAAAEIFAAAGVRWIASDEGVLLRSLASPDRRAIHQPHRLATPAGPIDLVFRDRGLSDLIGFTYAKWPAEKAVADLLGHLRVIGDDAVAPHGSGARPLVSIILDGENPWEHYPESGREFLDQLYRGLSAPGSPARTVRLGEALAERRPAALGRLHPGSWIDANFRIWIGHPEDVRGWEALGKVRRALGEAETAGLSAERLEQARAAIRVAEGSDWFWWYGDDFTTENAAEFDSLFRGYLGLACQILGIPSPAEIGEPISVQARQGVKAAGEPLRLPTSLIAPTIDGRLTRYGEWAGAGFVRASRGRGAMAQSALAFADLWFGFDGQMLYLRLDPTSAVSPGVSVTVELGGGFGQHQLSTCFPVPAHTPLRNGQGRAVGLASGLDILEVAIPLEALGARSGERLELAVSIRSEAVELQRFPSAGVLAVVAPDPDFDRMHWKV